MRRLYVFKKCRYIPDSDIYLIVIPDSDIYLIVIPDSDIYLIVIPDSDIYVNRDMYNCAIPRDSEYPSIF
jgi:hypothetical protein